MPFGIKSTPKITKAVSESLSDWNAGYSSTDKKVQAIFRKINWSASSFFNILTFGLDAYLKKRKIREIVKGEVSAFKVAQLSEFFKQRDSENPLSIFKSSTTMNKSCSLKCARSPSMGIQVGNGLKNTSEKTFIQQLK